MHAAREGNFNITLRNLDLTLNNYKSVMLTFQIGLHIDDLNILKEIKNKLSLNEEVGIFLFQIIDVIILLMIKNLYY